MNFHEIIAFLPNEIIEKLQKLEQNKKYHPEIYVYKHLELVYDKVMEYFPNDIEYRICAIFHDLGKIDATTFKKDGTPTSPGHENYAIEYIEKYLPKIPEINRKKIEEVCKYHMIAHLYNDGSMKNVNKRKAFEDRFYFKDIINFSKCDNEGRDIGYAT